MSVPVLITITVVLAVMAIALGLLAAYFDDSRSFLPVVGAVIAGIAAIVFVFVDFSTYNEHKKTDRGRGDAPRVSKHLIDGRTADGITEFPDGWGNVATKCVWTGWRAFESTKANGASSLVLVPDAECDFVATGPR